MKRCMTASLGGEDIELAATFKAASEIARLVADPLLITREIAMTAMLEGQSLSYDPKWRYTVDNLPVIIHIGMKAAGSQATLAQVQDMVFAAGFIAARQIATDYLTIICIPQSEELAKDAGSAGSSAGN